MVQRLPERQVDVPAGTPDGYVLTTTGEKAGWAAATGGGGGGTGVKMALWQPVDGTLVVGTGTRKLRNLSGSAWTILGVFAEVGDAPTGGDDIFDVNVSGTTIFTTQANRPTIAAGTTDSGLVTSMDVTTVPDGEYLTVDVDQATLPSSMPTLTVVYQ